MLNRHQTVADLVLDHSECAEVFHRYHVDFCCHGQRSVEEAAASRQMDPALLLKELEHAIAARMGERQLDPRALSTKQLVAHIVTQHHGLLRRALPTLRALATKVARVHGENNPKLRTLETAVETLATALLPHLDEEETSLFPQLTSSTPDKALIADGIATMLVDHLTIAGHLESVRAAADDFCAPDWACNSYLTLFSELRAMERDIHTHVHLENHVLRNRFATT